MSAQEKITIGQAIDQIVHALTSVEKSAQQTVLQIVCAHLGIAVGGIAAPATVDKGAARPVEKVQPVEVQQSSTGQPDHVIDIRTFRREKNPTSARQMACVVAYYLKELAPMEDRKQSVSNADMEKYFTQAGFELPTALEQLLKDAKKSGYFESVGRGEFKLTRVGQNLVTHSLPPGSKG